MEDIKFKITIETNEEGESQSVVIERNAKGIFYQEILRGFVNAMTALGYSTPQEIKDLEMLDEY